MYVHQEKYKKQWFLDAVRELCRLLRQRVANVKSCDAFPLIGTVLCIRLINDIFEIFHEFHVSEKTIGLSVIAVVINRYQKLSNRKVSSRTKSKYINLSMKIFSRMARRFL